MSEMEQLRGGGGVCVCVRAAQNITLNYSQIKRDSARSTYNYSYGFDDHARNGGAWHFPDTETTYSATGLALVVIVKP